MKNIFYLGTVGIESISHALNHSGCGVRILDLRLNTKLGSEGISHVAVAVARGCNLTRYALLNMNCYLNNRSTDNQFFNVINLNDV